MFAVTAYGALCDGTTNDTTAIQNAINAAGVAGGTVLIPASANGCLISTGVTVTLAKTAIVGVGLGGSKIKCARTTGDCIKVDQTTVAGPVDRVFELRGLQIAQTATMTSGSVVNLVLTNPYIEENFFEMGTFGAAGTALSAKDLNFGVFRSNTVSGDDTARTLIGFDLFKGTTVNRGNTVVSENFFNRVLTPIRVAKDASTGPVNNISIANNKFVVTGSGGDTPIASTKCLEIYSDARSVTVETNHFERCETGLYADGVDLLVVRNNSFGQFATASGYGVDVTATAAEGLEIAGNRFANSSTVGGTAVRVAAAIDYLTIRGNSRQNVTTFLNIPTTSVLAFIDDGVDMILGGASQKKIALRPLKDVFIQHNLGNFEASTAGSVDLYVNNDDSQSGAGDLVRLKTGSAATTFTQFEGLVGDIGLTRCLRLGNATSTTNASCICRDSLDRLWEDRDCDNVYDAGEAHMGTVVQHATDCTALNSLCGVGTTDLLCLEIDAKEVFGCIDDGSPVFERVGAVEWTDEGTSLIPADTADECVRMSGDTASGQVCSTGDNLQFDVDGNGVVDFTVTTGANIVTFDLPAATLTTFEFINSNPSNDVQLDVERPTTTGGCSTLKEGTDDVGGGGFDDFAFCIPTTGLNDGVTGCTLQADGRLPDSCVGDGTDGGGGSGDVNDVGPGCATGACWTDTVVTTGGTILVWEGVTSDASEFSLGFVGADTDPSADISWLIPDAAATITFPSGTRTLATLDGTETLTGKTITMAGSLDMDGQSILLNAAGDSSITDTGTIVISGVGGTRVRLDTNADGSNVFAIGHHNPNEDAWTFSELGRIMEINGADDAAGIDLTFPEPGSNENWVIPDPAVTDAIIPIIASSAVTSGHIVTFTGTAGIMVGIAPNAGTDVTADLEEEAHCSEHDSADVDCSGETVVFAANSVDGTNIALGSDTGGDVMYYDGTDWVRLAKGTAGQVLEMNAGATAPEWDTDDSGGGGTWDTIGDAAGNGEILMANTDQQLTWDSPATSTAVVGFDIQVSHDSTTDSAAETLLKVERTATTGTAAYDVLLHITNEDTDGAVTTGLKLDSAAGLMTTAIEASDAEIGTAIAIGSNDVTVGGATIDSGEFDVLDGGLDISTDLDAATSADLAGVLSDENGSTTGFVQANGTATLTNKTLDAEGTGNVLTTVSKLWIPSAGCNNATAAPMWDLPTANAPAIACVTGSNTQKAVADFDQTTDESMQMTLMLPTDWTGNVDVAYKWLSTVTSGNVAWCTELICVADAETDDPAFPGQGSGNCVSDATKGTTNQTNDAADTAITATGCAAGELMHIRVSRDPNETGTVSDTLAGDARLIGVELTLRRAQ
jgi:hypothetical protein